MLARADRPQRAGGDPHLPHLRRGAAALRASSGHDGKPAGLYAQTFRSDPGEQNGLYLAGRARASSAARSASWWRRPPTKGSRSAGPAAAPFHGYYFRILTAQGAAAPGGAKSYVVNGDMSGGFALVAWPAEYDVTGVMTFIVNQDGVVYEKDLGPESAAMAGKMTRLQSGRILEADRVALP